VCRAGAAAAELVGMRTKTWLCRESAPSAEVRAVQAREIEQAGPTPLSTQRLAVKRLR